MCVCVCVCVFKICMGIASNLAQDTLFFLIALASCACFFLPPSLLQIQFYTSLIEILIPTIPADIFNFILFVVVVVVVVVVILIGD